MDHVQPDSDAVFAGTSPGAQWPDLGRPYLSFVKVIKCRDKLDWPRSQKPMGLSAAHLLWTKLPGFAGTLAMGTAFGCEPALSISSKERSLFTH